MDDELSFQTPRIPVSLRVVAFLFWIGGLCSLIEIVVSLIHSHININFGVLGLLIGPGLLRLSRGWRTCALVFVWLGMIAIPVLMIIFAVADRPLDLKLFGEKIGEVSPLVGVLACLIGFAFNVWQFRVLTSHYVKQLFGVFD